MIVRNAAVCMVMPRAEVEMRSMTGGDSMYQARCVKCKKIIADDSTPIEASGLKPDGIRSLRVKCHHYVGREKCEQINFVSHK